jgi:hypothetical protein
VFLFEMFAFANEMMFSPALRPLRRPGDPSKDMVWIPAVYNVFCDHYSGSLSQPCVALVAAHNRMEYPSVYDRGHRLAVRHGGL